MSSFKSESTFVAKSIAKLYLDADFADVHFTFATDGETIRLPAHKAILAIENPIFREMFYGPMKTNDIIEIVDASASAFEEFLQFFYLAEVTLTMENIKEVAHLADKYDMLESLSVWASVLKDRLTDANIIWGYQLAISLDNQPLMELCEERIKRFTKQALKSDAFLHCDKAVVGNILKSDSLNCKESDLFIGCTEWAMSSCHANGLDENEPRHLRSQLGECFHLIRFETMTLEEIGAIMASRLYRQLFSNDELADVICLQTDKNFNSIAFEHAQRKKRSLPWNSNAVLSYNPGTTKICLSQSKESSWFSVNASVLLGEIVCCCIYHRRGPSITSNVSYHSIMSIREYKTLTFAAADVSKILYTETVILTYRKTEYIKLPRPVEIQPNKMYEIRFDTQVFSTGGFVHFINTQLEYKLNEEFTITFHRNPTESLGGLVSSLKFNRVC